MTNIGYAKIVDEVLIAIGESNMTLALQKSLSREQLKLGSRIACTELQAYARASDAWAAEWIKSMQNNPADLIRFLKIGIL